MMFVSDEQYEIALKNGIKKSTVYARVYQYGWDIEKAITRKPMTKSECSRKYPDFVYELLKKNNIDNNVFHERICIGWNVLDACSIPPNKKKEYRAKNAIITNKKFLTVGINDIKEQLFQPIKNIEYSNKPSGGLWSSPYNEDSEYKSDWLRFCIQEDFSTDKINHGVLFTLKKDSRICVINSMEDLEKIYQLYKGNGIEESLFLQKTLNFEKLASDYDAIYLTDEGQWETRFPRDGMLGKGINLYGWDVETLLVLNFYCIKKWEHIDLE